jgi:protein-disulfide isomerase
MNEQNVGKPLITTPTAILLGAGLIAIAILISGGVIRVKGINSNVLGLTQATPTTQLEDAQPTELPVVQTISVDDDAVLGDPNAPVTIIEFSDYECPFCKRHFLQTHSELKKNYIDTGKAKLVFRDLPLSFHEPMATTDAMAAECAKEQGGDKVYFAVHDAIFTTTQSNGNGITKEQLYDIGSKQGLNATQFKSCVESAKYKDEIEKDAQEGSAVGATGTPTFFIGKSSADGKIQGKRIVGAQPLAAFQTEIDALLK